MRFSARTWMSFGVMVIAAWAVIKAVNWPLTTALFPVVIGITIFILATTELFSSLSKREETSREVSAKGARFTQEKPERLPVDKTLLAFLLILSFFLLILLVGFPIAIPLFVFFYLKIYGREKWGLSVGIAAGVWAFFMVSLYWLQICILAKGGYNRDYVPLALYRKRRGVIWLAKCRFQENLRGRSLPILLDGSVTVMS